ncbi:MAG: hypothetical protein CME84_06370 [Henriciella sp.]|nr:hypothetical protein [Henriciella sp.]MBF35076.1 hypothetical protein [Hyphomonadaceae bacterium]PHR74919.1 MAG: hypothetical protein COA64_13395 [Henriciella sp.]
MRQTLRAGRFLQQREHVRRSRHQAHHTLLFRPEARVEDGCEIAVTKLKHAAVFACLLQQKVHDLGRVSRSIV